MSGGPDTETGPGSAPGERLSVGAQLVAARQRRTLTADTVAQELRLDVAIIEALEHDDTSRLPAPIFVQGYIRSYARLLDLPEDELTRDYADQCDELPPLTVSRVESGLPLLRLPSGRLIRNVILFMLAAILLWLAYPFVDRLLENRGDTVEEQFPGRLEIPPAAR